MKKYSLDLSFSILLFVFCIFALSNLGFIFGLSINCVYILLSVLIVFIYLFKRKQSYKKIIFFCLIFCISFLFANFFIDTSFDGRCYHFTTEALFKLGFNPIYDNILDFANKNNIYYNLLFSDSYPNFLEIIRANFYKIFSNMESSKIVNHLLMIATFLYSIYFFQEKKLSKINSIILALTIYLCPVAICQINTKMADFALYSLFIFQLFSFVLFNQNKNKKINLIIFILSSISSIALKYTGLLNTFIIFSLILIFNKEKIKMIKIFLIVAISSFILCFQPYITNIIKYKNPFYPSIGFNKLDFMTKQNPKEFIGKPYIYKFFRSIFSGASDSRISNPETPKIVYKIPFTTRYDMPFISDDVRISGFGHLFSGMFLISLLMLFLITRREENKKEMYFIFGAILATTLLNPICWWARFVPQFYLFIIFVYFYMYKIEKKSAIFLLTLTLLNSFWIAKENLSTTAYKTYSMNKFYNELYELSLNKPILINIDKTSNDEDDASIIFRLNEYGINYQLSDKIDDSFKLFDTDCTISKGYKIKL